MEYLGLILPVVIGVAALIITYVCRRNNQKYLDFVMQHSIALKELNELNNQYQFATVGSGNIVHYYDNEAFFDTISTQDYLTYWLVYNQKQVRADIQNANQNLDIYNKYIYGVNTCVLGRYDSPEIPKNSEKLIALEKKIFDSKVARPITNFRVYIKLYLTRMNGRTVGLKHDYFTPEVIEQIIQKLRQKQGDYYLDNNIWQAICRVERGKVTNKMRFAVYNRDGNRCRRCRSPYDLEVDHIFPISKGGKSTFDNLQTLCHRCNSAKSNTIEAGVVNPASKRPATGYVCARCGAPMVRRNGPNGSFFGCPNYPKCTYTKQIR